MNKVFEDEFMDFQTALIALCLDVTEKKERTWDFSGGLESFGLWKTAV